MKVNFELLLKPKSSQGNFHQLFWECFELQTELSRLSQEDVIICNFPEDKPLKFKIRLKKSENIILCRCIAEIDVHWSKAYFYDKFRSKISSVLSQKFEVTFYSNDLSAYYAKKCFPILIDYETNLRKIVYFMFHFNDIEEVQGLTKKKIKAGKLNNFVEDLDLSELEKILFAKVWLLLGDSYEFCNIDNGRELYDKLLHLPIKAEFFSTWDLYLNPILRTDFIDEKNLQKIRDIRNKVAHHKTMSFNDWKFCRKDVRAYANKAHDIEQKLVDNKFYQTQGASLSISLSAISKHIGKLLERSDIAKVSNLFVKQNMANLLEGLAISKIELPKATVEEMATIAKATSNMGIVKIAKEQTEILSRITDSIDVPRLDLEIPLGHRDENITNNEDINDDEDGE